MHCLSEYASYRTAAPEGRTGETGGGTANLSSALVLTTQNGDELYRKNVFYLFYLLIFSARNTVCSTSERGRVKWAEFISDILNFLDVCPCL
jgi:hypothetical protein